MSAEQSQSPGTVVSASYQIAPDRESLGSRTITWSLNAVRIVDVEHGTVETSVGMFSYRPKEKRRESLSGLNKLG